VSVEPRAETTGNANQQTDAIESLGNDVIKLAPLSVVEECLHARSIMETAAADSVICIDLDDCAVLLLNALATETDLIVDRGLGLKIR